jgi:hypothetical protein
MLGGSNGKVDNGGDSMTVIAYDDHCYSDVKPYEVTIYTDDGDILYHGKTKRVVLEGTADLSKIKGGKGEPISY